MRVLWLSDETPDVGGQGGQRRQFFQIRAVRDAGHDVTVTSIVGPQSDASVQELARTYRIRPRIGRAANPLFAATAWLKIHRDWDRIVIAHTESWVRWGKVALSFDAPLLVDMHNVLSSWHRSGGRDAEASHWGAIEKEIATQATISVCSATEAERLSPTANSIIVLPHGVEPSEWSRVPARSATLKVKLFGNWYWQPNRDGLAWFAHEVWERLSPNVLCEVAGTGAETMRLPAGMRMVGRVESVSDFLSDALVVAVPVRGGVGAPVKYLEALSSGVPVVATPSAAAFEVPFRTYTSDDPREWVDFVAAVSTRPEKYFSEASEIRSWTLGEMSWTRASRPLVDWVSGPNIHPGPS